jgi:hypothetical protein
LSKICRENLVAGEVLRVTKSRVVPGNIPKVLASGSHNKKCDNNGVQSGCPLLPVAQPNLVKLVTGFYL